MDTTQLTISEALIKMESGEITSEQLVQSCLDVIRSKDKNINAFLDVWHDEAIKTTRAIDEKRKNGKPVGKLAGIPIALKDNILWQGHSSRASSKILEPYKAAYSATVVEKLLAEDAVFIGTTNCDEFACGASTENSGFKKTSNPYDLTRVPGGSSGGSASAVASGMCLASLGSDTGGSIRQPASFCGIVGIKPTYGRVSRFGLIAMASSLDQIGAFGKTVDCVARVLEIIEGKDEKDATSENIPPTNIELIIKGEADKKLSDITIGIPKEYFIEGGIDADVARIVRSAIEALSNKGAKVKEISLPNTKYALPTYYVLMPCEVSSNTARYDGIRFGLSKGKTLREVYEQTRLSGFGDEVKRRILLGAFALSHGYFDEYYKKAIAVKSQIRNDFLKAFAKCDVIACPTAPTVAFHLGERESDPLKMYLSDVYTCSANLAGIPGISVPCGKAEGLPVGLQLMSPHFSEARLLHVASFVEK